MDATQSKFIIYTLSVTVTRPVDYDNADETISQKAEWLQGREAKRELEKEVLHALLRLDGDCDCEVMETVIENE